MLLRSHVAGQRKFNKTMYKFDIVELENDERVVCLPADYFCSPQYEYSGRQSTFISRLPVASAAATVSECQRFPLRPTQLQVYLMVRCIQRAMLGCA